MQVRFELTEREMGTLREMMKTEHAGHYARHWQSVRQDLHSRGMRPEAIIARPVGYSENRQGFSWCSSTGNVLIVHPNGAARYRGPRNGLVNGGFLGRCAEILKAAQDRGDWEYVETREPYWSPLETRQTVPFGWEHTEAQPEEWWADWFTDKGTKRGKRGRKRDRVYARGAMKHG